MSTRRTIHNRLAPPYTRKVDILHNSNLRRLMVSADEDNRIRENLKDFMPIEPSRDHYSTFVNILAGDYDPPAYIVQILLLGVLGLKNYGRLDKVWWHTFFQYKGYPFMIRDYKFGSWTIEGIRDDEEITKLAKEIRNKIAEASKPLDLLMHRFLKRQIDEDNFI